MDNKYMQELQKLKDWDEVQGIETTKSGYQFIYTAGHGYLVVPREDQHFREAFNICSYGFKGVHAVYLEEDCEYGAFLNAIK